MKKLILSIFCMVLLVGIGTFLIYNGNEVEAISYTQIEDDVNIESSINSYLKDGNLIIEYNNPNDEMVWIERLPNKRYDINEDEVIIYDYQPNEFFKLHIGEESDVYGFGREIGYEFLDNNSVVHVWNTQDNYYFDVDSGIQLTNHYEDYWSKNEFILECPDVGWKVFSSDLNDFNLTLSTDNLTYVNLTGYLDHSFAGEGKKVRFYLTYHLGLKDENLTIDMKFENIGNSPINQDLYFGWKVTDLNVPPETTDKILINNTNYELNGIYDLTFKDMKRYVNTSFPTNQTTNGSMIYNYSMVEIPIPFYKIYDRESGLTGKENFLRIDWDENLDYAVKMYGDGNQESFYTAILINAGQFDSGQEKSTTFYWIDALDDNLVSYYKLDENAANTDVKDSHGANDLTASTNTSNLYNAEGKINSCFDFTAASTENLRTTNFIGYEDFTFTGWFNTTSLANNPTIIDNGYSGSTNPIVAVFLESNVLKFRLRDNDGAGIKTLAHGTTLETGRWYFFAATFDVITGQMNLSLNDSGLVSDTYSGRTFDDIDEGIIGSQPHESAGSYFDGNTDEIGIWNGILNSTEITELYGDGTPPSYPFVLALNITLNSPIDNYDTLSNSITFNGSVYDISGNDIASVSLYIDGVLNETNSSGINNTDYIFTKTLSDGDHNWTYEACNDRGHCKIATTRSLSILKIIINSQTYNNETIEGATETFMANVTLRGGEVLIETNLNYNGTSRSATTSSLGDGTFNLISTFTIPSVIADTNLTFFWMITLTTEQVNLSSFNQTVKNMGIDNCTTYSTVIFNYTIVDEESQKQLVGNTDNTSLELNIEIFNLDKSVSVLNFSTSYNQTNPSAVCLNINLTNNTIYALDSTAKYSADNYVIEHYNIQNFELKNSSIPQEINLFDLLEDASTDFQISFKGEDFVFVENALVFIERQYVSEGVFKTVEIPKTDSNGRTIGHFVRNDIVYNIRVVKEGEILGSFNNMIAFCKDYVIGDCQIVLEAIPSALITFDYDEQLGIIFQSVPTYNNNTDTVIFSFVTDDATIKTVSMEVTRSDIFGNRSICNSTLTSASGTLLCTIPTGLDDTSLITSVYVDNQLVVLSNIELEAVSYGNLGYVLWFFLTFFFILLFGKSKTEILIALVISLTGAITLGITRGNIIGIGSAGIWMLVIVILGIWKLNKENPQ